VTVKWWKASEIPLGETEWKNVELYCHQEMPQGVPGVYFIRLSPPFTIRYGTDEEYDTPLIYFEKGALEADEEEDAT